MLYFSHNRLADWKGSRQPPWTCCQYETKACMCFWSNQAIYCHFWKKANFSTFPLSFMLHQSLLITSLLSSTFAECTKSAVCQTNNPISGTASGLHTSIQSFPLWLLTESDRSLLCSAVYHLSNHSTRLSPSVGECWAVMSGGLHVDLGTFTSARWACGLAAASRLLFCLYNRITSTKQKEGTQSAVPRPSSFIQLFRQVLGVWSAACWALPASACTHTDTRSLGNTQPWNFLPVSQEWSAGSTFDGICLALTVQLLFWESLWGSKDRGCRMLYRL